MVIMRRHLLGRALPALLVLAVACGAKGEVSPPPQADDPVSAATALPAAPAVPPQQSEAPVAAAPSGDFEAAGEDVAPLEQTKVAALDAPDDPTVQPVAAQRPRRLARQIIAAERIIRSPHASAKQLAVAGHTQQVAYRAWSERPRWDATVLAELPPRLRGVARLGVKAHRELASLSGSTPPKTLPAWRIVKPAPRTELKRYYRKAERIFGVPWEYLAAINLVETRMGRIRGVSTAGAQGPMQFIPPTWAIYGKGDVNDNHDAIMAAARYLRARGAPHDMSRALYSYNNSYKYVRAVAAHAEAMRRDPRVYRGYYHWQVYYRQHGGPVWLQVGYNGR
jgi:membrane-bound lytic murein transglycosylase B